MTYRIVIAEDETVIRNNLARLLRIEGFDVVVGTNGREALELIQQDRPDLVLSDVMMPEMDGIELAQKAQALVPPPLVMFITGFAAVALQANDAVPEARLLSKPFHLKDLVREVDALFSGRNRAGNG